MQAGCVRLQAGCVWLQAECVWLQAVEANGLAGIASTARLDWKADEDALRQAVGVAPFDLVVGADLLYDDDAVRA